MRLVLLVALCGAFAPAEELPGLKAAPYAKLADGGAITVEGNAAYVTRDGKTWSAPVPLFAPGQKIQVSNERVLLRTREGTIILAFMNLADRAWGWDEVKNEPHAGAKLEVWTVRSLDEGKTWRDAHRIQPGYCGAVRHLLEMRSGRVVLTSQYLAYNPGRHVTVTHSTDDQGITWVASNTIDLGGRGHHDGAIEATVAELRDGRLWMLLRTNWDRFWEAFSDDGRSWRTVRPTAIDASSSPGYLLRLESGRLMLAWNRLYPEGTSTFPRRGGSFSAEPASVHRGELSVAFSDDDGATWSAPAVVARRAKGSLAYPWLFEHAPGEIWITTMQGGLRINLREADHAAPVSAEIVESTIAPATAENRRNSEGDVIVLHDGTLLAAWSDFYGGEHDDSAARISGAKSRDGGRTWGSRFTLQENTGKQNVMSVSFLRSRKGEILMFYLQKDSPDALYTMVRRSPDEGRTWGAPLRVGNDPGYYVMNNARAVRLRSGRIVLPMSFTGKVWTKGEGFRTVVYRSDDDGWTWTRGQGAVSCPQRGAMEPGLLEMNDGRLLQIIRTQTGKIWAAWSADGGDTWTAAEPWKMAAPEAPSTLFRMPSGALLLVYNPTVKLGTGHSGPRTPLAAAVSRDEGRTWEAPKTIEGDPAATYAYTSVTQYGNRLLLTYYVARGGLLSLKFKSIPMAWFGR